MKNRHYLQIPGPTNIPEPVLRSLSTPMENHRGPAFKQMLEDIVQSLKYLLRTSGDILIFPSSGSGSLEASVVNLFSKGDKIISVHQGTFSQRYGIIAEAFGLDVVEIKKEFGKAIQPEDVVSILREDKDQLIKAVCLPQNETATGVANDIEAISKAIKETGHPALLVVDGVSSIACVPFFMDQWQVDVVITASQKGLMLPPGLGIVALNQKAWACVEKSDLPKWYWDFEAVRKSMTKGQFPYTPAISLFYGLKVALDLLKEEGLENVWTRHQTNARLIRRAGQAMGLSVLADDSCTSDTVTAFYLPEGLDFAEFSRLLEENYYITIGGGLGELEGKIFRIGHLGALSVAEVFGIMCSLELALHASGHKVVSGSAAEAIAQEING